MTNWLAGFDVKDNFSVGLLYCLVTVLIVKEFGLKMALKSGRAVCAYFKIQTISTSY